VRQALSTGAADLFVGLLRSVGPAGPGMAALLALGLPPEARAEADRLASVIQLVQAAASDLRLTIDPVEYRGLEYQTGVSFTFYALDTRGELGRGGRYRAGYPEDEMAAESSVVPIGGPADADRPARRIGRTEAATGFTLYMDTVSAAARVELPGKRLYVPSGVAWTELARYQHDGYLTVRGLDAIADASIEARRLGCSHVLLDGRPVAV
jgi:ATP phosphoribosyltransferase regulatory subunit